MNESMVDNGSSAYEKKYALIHILSLLALTFICYWKFLDNFYVLEDTAAPYAGFVLNDDISKIFTESFTGYGAVWRVVVMLSYIPNYWISGIDPWSYRLFSLIFHFINAVLVYLIANRLTKNITVSFIVAVLFSVSLNKVSTIGMAAHRVTLFGALFPFLSLYFYIRLIQENFSKKNAVFFLLSFMAAIGSYETGLIMPAVYITFALLFKRKDLFSGPLLWLTSISLLVSLSIIFGLHLGTSSHGMSIIADKTLIAKAFHMIKNILAIFPSFLIPPFIIQKSLKGVYYSQLTDFGWIEFLSIVLIISIAIYSIKSKNKVVLFALLFFVITSIPVSIIQWGYFPELYYDDPRHGGWLRFDVGRYSYLSSFGFYLIIGIVLHDLFETITSSFTNRKVLKICATAMLLSYVVFNVFWIHKREKYWQVISDNTRSELESIKSLNLTVDHNTAIYHYFGPLYGYHGRNMLRALYKIPDLEVFDLNFELHKIKPHNKKTIVIYYEYSGYKARYLRDNSAIIRQKQGG